MTLLLDGFVHDVRVVSLASGMLRVTRADGAVLGYLEEVAVDGAGADAVAGSGASGADAARPRFRAKRMLAHERRFAIVGDYWTREDALDALRVV